jgi:hypothetical protein
MIIYATITSSITLAGVVLSLWLIRANNLINSENIKRINATFAVLAEKVNIEKVERKDEV